MTYVFTKDQYLSICHDASERLGISSVALYEHAASKVLKNIDLDKRHSFLIVCGNGENGRLGLVVSRLLLGLDKKIILYLLGNQKEISVDYEREKNILKKLGQDFLYLDTLGDIEAFSQNLDKVNTLIDAISGLEQTITLDGVYDYLIEQMNKSRRYIISLDIPSGFLADSIKPGTSVISPDLIVTFTGLKPCLVNNPYLRQSEIKLENIGIPNQSIRRFVAQRPKF